MASLKDVAKLANVSLMTVSRALNSPERLKPETLARVQLAIEQTSYVPDLSAKKIRGAHASPKTIGVLASPFRSLRGRPFGPERRFS